MTVDHQVVIPTGNIDTLMALYQVYRHNTFDISLVTQMTVDHQAELPTGDTLVGHVTHNT